MPSWTAAIVSPPRWVEAHQQGVQWIVRWNSGMPLWTAYGEAFDLAATLRAVPPSQALVTRAVQLGPARTGARVGAWLQAYRLDEVAAQAARRRCRRRGQKSGKRLKARTLYLAGWVVVVTTLEAALWRAATILAWYRVRWQVEVAIKRCKSLLAVGRLRARAGGPLATVWLYGKLVYALLLEQRSRRLVGDHWGTLERPRQATWWRSGRLMTSWMVSVISGVTAWHEARWPACLQVMKERPRRRALQTVPATVQRLLRLASRAATRPAREARAA